MITKEQAKEKLCCANAHMNLDEDDCFELYELIESQAKIIDKLPKYVDGTPFVPGLDDIYIHNGHTVLDCVLHGFVCKYEKEFGKWVVIDTGWTYHTDFYPTREAAERARNNSNE